MLTLSPTTVITGTDGAVCLLTTLQPRTLVCVSIVSPSAFFSVIFTYKSYTPSGSLFREASRYCILNSISRTISPVGAFSALAFAKIADEYPDMRLIIFGEGENRNKLEKLIEEKNLIDRISLPGNVSDIADRICSARIFTLTSNTEGMPNSIMEAMALGIPVISTDCPCGGPAMLIEDSVNGLLVPVGDAYALADAFRKILSDNEFEITLGNNAYESSKKYDPQKVNSQWEKFLNEL